MAKKYDTQTALKGLTVRPISETYTGVVLGVSWIDPLVLWIKWSDGTIAQVSVTEITTVNR